MRQRPDQPKARRGPDSWAEDARNNSVRNSPRAQSPWSRSEGVGGGHLVGAVLQEGSLQCLKIRDFKLPPICEILTKSRHGYMVSEVDDIVIVVINPTMPGYTT